MLTVGMLSMLTAGLSSAVLEGMLSVVLDGLLVMEVDGTFLVVIDGTSSKMSGRNLPALAKMSLILEQSFRFGICAFVADVGKSQTRGVRLLPE